jgi:argininosuccinate lyase
LKGVPFRRAHEAVGKAVAYAAARNVPLKGLTPGELAAFCPEADPDVLESLTLERLLAVRCTAPGGTSPKTVAAQLAAAFKELEEQSGGPF